MTTQEFLTVAGWIAEGKAEYKRLNGEWTCGQGFLTLSLTENFNQYRCKTEPKFRQWKPEEVPVGGLLRDKSITDKISSFLVTFKDSRGHIPAGLCRQKQWKSPSDLLEDFEHSLDHGKTWLPCGVQEG